VNREALWTPWRRKGTVARMGSSMVVRVAEQTDGDALGEVERRTWSTLHSVQPRPVAPYDPFFDAAHRPDQFLVAEDPADGIAGFIRTVRPTSLACHAHVRQIQGLAVDLWARRRGVAAALVDAACERARREGAVRMTLRVLGHNAPARRVYESAGFVVEGVLPGEFLLDGAYVDDVLMGRRLMWTPNP